MKKLVVAVLMIAALSVAASALELDHITTLDNSNHQLYTSIEYKDNLESSVQITIPDLDARVTYLDDGDLSDKTDRLILEIPQDAAPGDYLVRYVVSDDDQSVATYRWITVQ